MNADQELNADGRWPDLESYLDRASALELARRSLIGAPVYAVLSLVMLLGTPIHTQYGWWTVAEGGMLVLLGGIRFFFARGFEQRYERLGEQAVVQFSLLTALQSLTLGVLAAMVIWFYWSTSEVVLTVVLSAGCIAAGTSALSIRKSAHAIFLACVLVPLGIAVLLVGGAVKALLILGFLVLMAFLVQDGGQARRNFLDKLKNHYCDQLTRRRIAIENQAIKQYTEGLVHELRTPVHTIVGLLDPLLDGELSEVRPPSAQALRQNCNLLVDLVNNIPGSAEIRARAEAHSYLREPQPQEAVTTSQAGSVRLAADEDGQPLGEGDTQPQQILVVDDDEVHRAILSAYLEKCGYQPDQATDGQQAIEAVKKKHYDLIFMDLRMPGMGGLEAIRWIREHFDDKGRPIRIIVLTADHSVETRSQCYSAGADQFLAKPILPHDLEPVLNQSSVSAA
jgi:CheY-like chemotaxis protein